MDQSWIELYWQYIGADKIEEAIPLKLSNFPKAFYKYKGLTERTIQAIDEGYIWLAEVSSLNDPFEGSIQFDNDECLRLYYSSPKFHDFFKVLTGKSLTKGEIKTLSSSVKPYLDYMEICKAKGVELSQTPYDQIDKVQKRWAEVVKESNKDIRICCFSIVPDSLLMWSHYADEHKGICIQYDFEESDTIRAFIQPVNYTNSIHKIGIFEEYSTIQLVAANLLKSKDWEYEKEWRVTIFRQGDYFPQKLEAPKPTAIYLGTRFDLNEDNLKTELLTLAQERGIPVYKMTKHPTEYKIVLMEVLASNTP